MKSFLEHYELSLNPIPKHIFEAIYSNMSKGYGASEMTGKYYKGFNNKLLTHLIDSPKYIGVPNLKEEVINKTIGYYEFHGKVGHRHLKLYFGLFHHNDKVLPFQKYADIIAGYILFCDKMAKKHCSESLTIYCYLTHHKRYIHEGDKVLGAKNVNGGVTYSCSKNNQICVYRKEELMKVCFHEILHSMGLDSDIFDDPVFIRSVSELFNVKTTEIYNEAYIEFFAIHFYIIFVSLIETTTMDDAYELANNLIEQETYFSMFQMVKILRHFNLRYIHLLQNHNTESYKESSNVFAYYILKTVMLYHNNDVLASSWNDRRDIFELIKEIATNPDFLRDIIQFEAVHNFSKELNKTMRMSLHSI